MRFLNIFSEKTKKISKMRISFISEISIAKLHYYFEIGLIF